MCHVTNLFVQTVGQHLVQFHVESRLDLAALLVPDNAGFPALVLGCAAELVLLLLEGEAAHTPQVKPPDHGARRRVHRLQRRFEGDCR